MTLSSSDVRRLLDEHGLRPSKARGQHFVTDPNTVRRIARLARVGADDRVVEIGAGLGSLTLALAETGATVTAVEVDRGLVTALRSVVEPAGVTVVEGDALTLDWDALLGAGRWVLVANLPYNVATPMVAELLDRVPAIARMLVMVQREVAQRLVAGAGDDAYGAVSVKVAYWARAAIVGSVPPTVFLPQPNVESSLVEIVRRDVPAVAGTIDTARLFHLVSAGFGQRRKMLRRSLASLVEPEAFAVAGVRPEARAEELDLDDWAKLAAASPRSAEAGSPTER